MRTLWEIIENSANRQIVHADESMGDFSMISTLKRKIRTQSAKKFLAANCLAVATTIGGVFGIIVGFAIGTPDFSKRDVMYLGFVGKLFLNALKGLMIPLIVSSMITAVATLDLKHSSRIAARTVAWYFLTTAVQLFA